MEAVSTRAPATMQKQAKSSFGPGSDARSHTCSCRPGCSAMRWRTAQALMLALVAIVHIPKANSSGTPFPTAARAPANSRAATLQGCGGITPVCRQVCHALLADGSGGCSSACPLSKKASLRIALSQKCEDMYSTIFRNVEVQTASALKQKILKPDAEAWLDDYSAQHPLPWSENPVYMITLENNMNDYPACEDLSNIAQTQYSLKILLSKKGAPALGASQTQGGRSQGSEMKRRQALELAKQPYQTVNSAQQAPATAPQATEAPTLAPAPMLISNDDAALAPAPNTGASLHANDDCEMMEENVTQDILSALDKLFPDGFVETCVPILSNGAASQYSTQCLQIGTVIVEAESSLSGYFTSSKGISVLEEELQQLGCSDLPQCQQCFEYLVLLRILGEVLKLVYQPGLAPAPGPTPDQIATQQAPATAPLTTEAPELAPAPTPDGDDSSAPAPAPDSGVASCNYNPVVEAIDSLQDELFQGDFDGTCLSGPDPAYGVECIQVLTFLIDAEGYYFQSLANRELLQEGLQELGCDNAADCPDCEIYLQKEHVLDALIAFAAQLAMTPAPGPAPNQEHNAPQTAPAMAPAPELPPQSGPGFPVPPASGPGEDPCNPRPIPTLLAPEYTTEPIVGFQLDFPAGYVLPDCAPDCLITLSCGEARLHPTQQGYSISRPFNPPINPDGIYDLTLFFPFAAKYPPQGMEPPIITSCINYHPQPCDSSAQIQLGDITFDTTLPTLIITKVAEQFGNPTTTTLRKLQTVQPLFALMLFNFSKSIGNLTADNIVVTGGKVTEVIPVPHTYDFFVWLQVSSGAGSLHIALTSGSISDVAGNILYSDPSDPEVFTIISNNGQYSATITYPSPPTYPPPSSSVMVAVAHLLSKGAVTGIVIGVFAGVGIVLLVMAITWGVLRRRGAYQREQGDVAETEQTPPKTVNFKGSPGAGKAV